MHQSSNYKRNCYNSSWRLNIISSNCCFICVITHYKCIPWGLVKEQSEMNESIIRMCPPMRISRVFHYAYRLDLLLYILIWSICIISFTAATGFLSSYLFFIYFFMNFIYEFIIMDFHFAISVRILTIRFVIVLAPIVKSAATTTTNSQISSGRFFNARRNNIRF